MESKNWKQKLKGIIKERDSRFWLMLFVIVVTLSFFVVWSINIKNVFSKSVAFSDDLDSMGVSNSGEKINLAFSEFSSLLEKAEEPKLEEEASLSDDDLGKIIEALNYKIENESASTTASSTDEMTDDKNSSSSDPILYPELDESDQAIKELKKRIEELEKKLGE